jgi:NADH-quinone oxidoreductase subunit I
MKPDDPDIRWVEEPQLGLSGKLYLPMFADGLSTTVRHLTNSLRGDVATVSYPDKEPMQSPGLGGTL